MSIDVPSGMFAEWNADNLSRNIIHADLTLAMQFPRLAFFISDNAEYLGEWKVLDIELSQQEIKNTQSQYFLLESMTHGAYCNGAANFHPKTTTARRLSLPEATECSARRSCRLKVLCAQA